MASLTGASIASSYTSLLKLNGNTDSLVAGNDSNAIQVVDGDGTASALYLNTDRLGIGGQPKAQLHIIGNDTTDQVIIENSDTSSTSAPDLVLYSKSDSDSDNIGLINFRGLNDNASAEDINYASITGTIVDSGDGSEDGALNFYSYKAGSENLSMAIKSGNVGIGVDSAVVAIDVHADTTETAAVFGQADDGNCYIATRVGEVQNRVNGYIFQVGSTATAGYGSANTLATIISAVKNDGGALQGDLTFAVNGGDSLANRFNIASNGDLTATDTSIGSISDERFKTNIKDYSGGLDTINALRPVTFEHKESTKLREGTQRGFIAQEVEKVDSFYIRKSTATEEDDFYDLVKDDGAEYYISKITEKDTLYVSAIKEMSAQIDALTKRIEALEA